MNTPLNNDQLDDFELSDSNSDLDSNVYVCVCVYTPGDDPSASGAAQSPGAAGDGGSSQRAVQ